MTLFKNCFKLGEDILSTIDFDHTDVPCVQFTVTLQSEEVLNPHYRRKSTQISSITSHAKQSEFCLSTYQTYLSLSIPLACTPTFSMDLGKNSSKINLFFLRFFKNNVLHLVSLRWKLHFEFAISKNLRDILPTTNDPSTSTIWSTPNSMEVESMIWDLPIKVLPTNPYFANSVAKFPCTTVAII